jgi:hypothetical protein
MPIKFIKVCAVIVTCLLLGINLSACTSVKVTPISYKPTLPGDTVLAASEIQADAEQLVSIVESAHPAFSIPAMPQGYDDAKKTFLAAALKEMTVDDFSWLANTYLTSFKDGHTQISFSSSTQSLDIAWIANGSKLLLLDAEGKLTGKQVTEIGGVAVEQVFQTVGRMSAAENDAGKDANDTLLSGCATVLQRAGVSTDTGHVALTLKDGSQTTTQDVAFIQKDPYAVYSSATIITSSMVGDVFYIDFNHCNAGTELDSTVAKLKNAVAAGTKKVIIDVRDNPGGNSQTCETLLGAMGMKAPGFGSYTRYSPLASEQEGSWQKSGSTTRPVNPGEAKGNANIALIVLTNEYSFSAATMLGVFVQDGKLGTIIGRASGNSPSNYGNALDYQLTNSRIHGSVSFKRWLRPDAKGDQKTLQPDVVVPVGGDSLQAALDYLKSK